jgi:Tol biopolymer transport system component
VRRLERPDAPAARAASPTARATRPDGPGPFRGDRAWLGPAISVVGLVVVAFLTAGLFGGRLPVDLPGGVGATPRPTTNPVIVVPKGTDVRGTVLFVKAGNIWAASGTGVHQLSRTGNDSSPAWSADGKSIYLIETRTKTGLFPYEGTPSNYTLHYPVIVRMNADGTGRKVVASSLYTTGIGGRYIYHAWYLQPAPDPKGTRIAIVSDGPNPIGRDPVLQFMPAAGGKLTSLNLPFTPQLGLADPTWRPDGAFIAYTRYERSGSEPAHRIGLYNVKTKAQRNLAGPGFSQPAWSPDGRYLAAVRWSATGRDVVILDAKTGAQLLAVTNDGHSWAPAWSPAGDAIVFLTASGEDLDLDMTVIRRTGSAFSLGDRLPVTDLSQLDGTSRPSWYVPPELLPTPAPSATPAPTPSSSAPSSSASPTP